MPCGIMKVRSCQSAQVMTFRLATPSLYLTIYWIILDMSTVSHIYLGCFCHESLAEVKSITQFQNVTEPQRIHYLCLFIFIVLNHDDVIKWKYFPRYWPFLRVIHQSPMLMFSLICVWINGWVNNREAGDLRRYRAHYDVTIMHRNDSTPVY